MIFFVYVILVFLVLRFSVTLFNFLSNPKLGHYGKHFSDKVSIFIALTDPADAAGPLLEAIKEQDYQNLEVMMVPLAERHQMVLEKATGKYLLFLDANMVISKGLINNLICRTKVFNLALLSLLPNKQIKGWAGWLFSPLIDFVQINLFPLRLVRLSDWSAFSVANDSCLFIDTQRYKETNWYETEDEKQVKGLDLLKTMKQMRLKTEVLLANRFVYTVDVASPDLAGQQLLQVFGHNVLATLIYLLLVIMGPVWLYINFNLAFVALPLGLIFLTRIMISFLTAQNPVINVLLHPLQMLTLLWVLLKAIAGKFKVAFIQWFVFFSIAFINATQFYLSLYHH